MVEKIPENATMLYIKLGTSGEWEKECIFNEQTIKIGFTDIKIVRKIPI